MLVLRPIGGGQSRYYLEGPAPGVWVGGGSAQLGLSGPVEPSALHDVLAGRQPDGDLLLARVPRARRSGFDMILAAPKSVSLLGALADEHRRAQFAAAHTKAVESALGYLERESVRTRRGSTNTRIATTGLVAAAFTHQWSAARDPHLHTHVVVANLVQGDDGRWSCLDSRSLYRHSRAASAVFQAGLRHHLVQQGLRFDWTVDRHGLGNVVGVPRSAIEAASLRLREVADEVEAGMAGRVGRATAGGRTRAAVAGSRQHPQQWRQRVAAAGLDQPDADQLLAFAAQRHALGLATRPWEPDSASLTALLSEQHSRFGRPDVVRAAAILSPAGAEDGQLERLAADFLTTAVPAGEGQWTTAPLKRLEQRIIAAAAPRDRFAVALVEPAGPTAGQTADRLDEVSRLAVERLTRGGAPVDLLRGDLIGQARVVDAARGSWEAGGHRVALVSPTERGQARWRALAGLERTPPSPHHATVLLVDAADRWSTLDLHRVVADAAARQAKVVLLEGGTSPPRPHAESPAFETLRTTLTPIDVTVTQREAPGSLPAPSPDPPGAAAAVRGRDSTAPSPDPPGTATAVRGGRDSAVTLVATGDAAMDRLVSDWHGQTEARRRPRMVALGPEEARHLNALARAVRVRAGELRGPSLHSHGQQFQQGDEVMALRRDPRLGSVPGGATGKVTAVDPDRHLLTLQWDRQPDEVATVVTIDPAATRPLPLTHSYAATPPYLRGVDDRPVLSLGHVEAVAPKLHPERVYEVLPTPTADRERGPLTALVGELALRRAPGQDMAVLDDVNRPLSELTAERDRLAGHLTSTVPPDPRPELRRVTEERQWLASLPDRTNELADTDRRLATLTSAIDTRTRWLDANRDQLQRWADLSRAIGWREAALGRGAEIRPTHAVLSGVGPPPDDPDRRQAWRRAARAIEAHRDQWALPDRPLDLGRSPTADGDLTRRAGELRVLAASKDLQRGRSRDLEIASSRR